MSVMVSKCEQTITNGTMDRCPDNKSPCKGNTNWIMDN